MERTSAIAERSLALPNELSYKLPKSSKSTISRREHISRSAEGTASDVQPGSTMIFSIPPASNKVLASSETYFSVYLKSPNNTERLGGPIQNIIERVRILSDNGAVLEDLQNFNVLNRIVQILHMNEDYLEDVEQVSGFIPTRRGIFSETGTEVGFADDGKTIDVAKDASVRKPTEVPIDSEGALNGSASGVLFVFRLEASGLLSTDKFFPLFAAGMRIELTLASADIALRVGTAYTVNYPKIHYTLLTMSDQTAATMSQALRAGNLHLPYFTFAHKQASIASGDSIDINLSQPLFRVKNIMAVIRANSTLTNGQDSFLFNNTNLYGSNAGHQLKYADSYFPVDRIESVKRAYYETKIALNQFGSIDCACLPYSEFASNNKHVICYNLESLMSDPFSGSSTKNSRNIELNIKWSSAPAASRLDAFTHHVRVMKLKGDGTLELLE